MNGSDFEAQPAGRASLLPARPQATEPPDQQWILGQGGGIVDDLVEHLVVPGRRQAEHLLDRLLLRPGVLPPLPLEGEDLPVAAGQPLADRPAGLRAAVRVDGRSTRSRGSAIHRGPPVLTRQPLTRQPLTRQWRAGSRITSLLFHPHLNTSSSRGPVHRRVSPAKSQPATSSA